MDTKKVVSDILSKRVDVSSLKEEDSLSSLGLDSLDLVEVMLEIEDNLNIEFDSNEIADVSTLGDVLKLIETKLNKWLFYKNYYDIIILAFLRRIKVLPT